MKNFISKVIFFLLMSSIVIYITASIIIYTNFYHFIGNGSIIYESIGRSKKINKSKILILGDSVGDQLFSLYKDNDTLNTLATMASVNMIGQFLILNNYLNAGNKIEFVYLIVNPLGFQNNLDFGITYSYFIKPFYNEEYKKYLSKNALNKLDKIPFKSLSQNPLIKLSDWTPPKILYGVSEKKNNNFLSEISSEYLIKMKELSIINNFKLKIISPPVRISEKSKINSLNKKTIHENNLDDVFENYFDQIIYLNDTCFIDAFHLIHPEVYTPIFKNKIIK